MIQLPFSRRRRQDAIALALALAAASLATGCPPPNQIRVVEASAHRLSLPGVEVRPLRAFPNHPGARRRGFHVVRTRAEWLSLWPASLPVPTVDFSREMILVAFSGERPSIGHAIALERITKEKGTLHVAVEERLPAPGCPFPPGATYPAALVAVPRHLGEVRFAVRQNRAQSCLNPPALELSCRVEHPNAPYQNEGLSPLPRVGDTVICAAQSEPGARIDFELLASPEPVVEQPSKNLSENAPGNIPVQPSKNSLEAVPESVSAQLSKNEIEQMNVAPMKGAMERVDDLQIRLPIRANGLFRLGATASRADGLTSRRQIDFSAGVPDYAIELIEEEPEGARGLSLSVTRRWNGTSGSAGGVESCAPGTPRPWCALSSDGYSSRAVIPANTPGAIEIWVDRERADIAPQVRLIIRLDRRVLLDRILPDEWANWPSGRHLAATISLSEARLVEGLSEPERAREEAANTSIRTPGAMEAVR